LVLDGRARLATLAVKDETVMARSEKNDRAILQQFDEDARPPGASRV